MPCNALPVEDADHGQNAVGVTWRRAVLRAERERDLGDVAALEVRLHRCIESPRPVVRKPELPEARGELAPNAVMFALPAKFERLVEKIHRREAVPYPRRCAGEVEISLRRPPFLEHGLEVFVFHSLLRGAPPRPAFEHLVERGSVEYVRVAVEEVEVLVADERLAALRADNAVHFGGDLHVVQPFVLNRMGHVDERGKRCNPRLAGAAVAPVSHQVSGGAMLQSRAHGLLHVGLHVEVPSTHRVPRAGAWADVERALRLREKRAVGLVAVRVAHLVSPVKRDRVRRNLGYQLGMLAHYHVVPVHHGVAMLRSEIAYFPEIVDPHPLRARVRYCRPAATLAVAHEFPHLVAPRVEQLRAEVRE